MSGSLNKCMIIGNLGKDPEIKTTNTGMRIANFSVATSETWKDKNSGERKELTQWHRIVVFNEHIVDVVEKYLIKGSKVYVEGAMQTRKWTDNNGAERYATEIVLQKFHGVVTILDGSRDNRQNGGDSGSGGGYGDKRSGGQSANQADDLHDEMPF